MADAAPHAGWLAALAAALAALLASQLHLRRGRSQQDALKSRLVEAEAQVAQLRKQLETLGAMDALQAATSTVVVKQIRELVPVPRSVSKAQVRIWMDGAFDMMHFGHANAFRQGRALGTHLVVGINDDASISRCKGAPPVMNDAERMAMVKACRFVDEVVPEVPYVMDEEYVRWVIQRYNIDFVVHGDDPCIVDGKDVYASAQQLGKYRTIPRTEGVSTTEIVGRMLLLTTEHHKTQPADSSKSSHARLDHSTSPLVRAKSGGNEPDGMRLSEALGNFQECRTSSPTRSPNGFTRESKFMTTIQMLRLFASGCGAPPAGSRVVYVDGGWDMFHAGHALFLEQAAKLGDFLLVGVHNDVVINRHRGSNFPIMNLNERVLSVLSCRFTGDVVIDPPWHISREMVAALNISVVAHGTVTDTGKEVGLDPYAVPKELGIYREIESNMPNLNVKSIIDRIQMNHEMMEAKVEKKMASEREYYSKRYGFQTS